MPGRPDPPLNRLGRRNPKVGPSRAECGGRTPFNREPTATATRSRRSYAGWQRRVAAELGATGFASAMGGLTLRRVAGRSEPWDIEGGAVPLRGRFCNRTWTNRVTLQKQSPKHWPSQWHTPTVPPGRFGLGSRTMRRNPALRIIRGSGLDGYEATKSHPQWMARWFRTCDWIGYFTNCVFVAAKRSRATRRH